MDFKKLPKVELHAHLNGSISIRTIQKLLNRKKESKSSSDFTLKQPSSMEEVFQFFPLIQSLTEQPENLKLATIDVIREFAEDGVVYLEIRSTPKNTKYMDKLTYVRTILNAIKESDGIVVTLILSIDRKQSEEEAWETVEIAIRDDSNLIVGVELSGDPRLDGRKFLHALKFARDAGLGVSVHLSELAEHTDEILEFLNFRPDRVGHGTFLHTRPEFVRLMRHYNIPLEICLTSNTMCKTTPTISDSHFAFWREIGTPIAICTDDKGLLNDCLLSQEFEKAVIAFNLSENEIREICRKSFEISFASRKLPASIIEEISEKINF